MNGMCKLMHFHTSQWTRTRHIFRFSRSGKRVVDVNSFISKLSSDYNAPFCHDSLSQLAIDASSHIKLMDTSTDSPRFDSTLRNKDYCKSWNAQIDESLR